MVVGALDDFTQILSRRSEAMEEQIPALQQKVFIVGGDMGFLDWHMY